MEEYKNRSCTLGIITRNKIIRTFMEMPASQPSVGMCNMNTVGMCTINTVGIAGTEQAQTSAFLTKF